MLYERGRRMPVDEEAHRLRKENRRFFLKRADELLERYNCEPYPIKKNHMRVTTLPTTVTVDEKPVEMWLAKRVHLQGDLITKRTAIVVREADLKPYDLFNIIQFYAHDAQQVIKTLVLNKFSRVASNADVASAVTNLNSIATELAGQPRDGKTSDTL